jgi:DNA relaxase NicK
LKTAIDWLTFRVHASPFDLVESMRPWFGTAADLLTFQPGIKAQDGWLRAGDLTMAGDIKLGRIDYDGQSQRGWVRVSLYGEGCGWVQDWNAAERLPEAFPDAEIRRLDIALTTYRGEVTHDMVIEAHGRREFSSGGRQPHYHPVGGGSDPRAGRTIYVGKRAGSDKMLRCYEKGWQMLLDVPESVRSTVTHINGHQVEQIYRVELELKAENKCIAWASIGQRDEVFAGAYPFCAGLLPGCDQIKLEAFPDLRPQLDLAAKLDSCRRSYGGIVRAAIEAYGGDRERVMREIEADTPSRALIEAGVLTCSHV